MSVPDARPAADSIVRVQDDGALPGVLERLRAEEVDVVCVCREVADPLTVADRIVAEDPDVAVLILTDARTAVAIDRERALGPTLAADVLLYTGEDVESAQTAAAARTRARRDQRSSAVRREPPPPGGRHLGRILDNAPIGIVTLERSGTVRAWNRRAERIFGAAVPGQPFAELFPAAIREPLREHLLASVDDGGESAVFERQTPDGEAQVLELAGGSLGPEGGDALLVLVQDVTGRVTAERRHRAVEELLTAVVSSVPDAVYVKNRDGRYLMINGPGAAVWGLTPDEIAGRTTAEVVHPDAHERIRANDRQVMDTGQAHVFDEEAPGPPRRWYSSTKAPFLDHAGRIAGIVGISRDITSRRLAETRAHQLADATRAVTETLDPAHAADRLADVVVRELADLCVVGLTDAAGQPGHVARAAAHPVDASLLDVLETLVPEALGHRAPTMLVTPREALRQVLALPLPGAAASVGTLIIAVTDDGARLDAERRETAEELARRAGAALENARLHAERTRIATTLQRSLLPPRLPAIPDVSLSVRFRASGAGVEVGGDFYDVFGLGDGWGVAIGDVCGKGPEAAAVTALARYTIRALALHEDRPEHILRGLNEALLTQRGGRDFCTAALLRLCGGRLTIAGGGHPPPLVLRADGTGDEVGPSGTLLGVLPDPTIAVHEIELRSGDTVVLYTDGLNEANAPARLFSPEDLLAAVRPAAGRGAEEVATRLADLVPSAAEPRDDIAIVVLSLD